LLPWRVRCGEGMEGMVKGAGGVRRRMRVKKVVGTARVALWWLPLFPRQGRCGEVKFLEGQRAEQHLPNAEQQLPSDATFTVSADLCLRAS
jgi:hypothetical protein